MTIRLLNHFDRLIDTPDAVPRLRRFILDLAVRGKLVEQDPKDEAAGELLKRIEKEKSRLAKAGTIRTPKPQSPMTEEEIPFGIPKSWRWVRLGEVGAIVGGGTPPSKDASCFTDGGNGIAWLTPADLGNHEGLYVAHGARDLTEKGLSNASAQLMPAGSVLFTSRAPIGYTAIAANVITTNQGFKSVVPFLTGSNRYIAVYFKAFATWINGKASGTTFKEVSGKIVGNLPFPLPPIAEQHRIVAKVDELMALCDELEAAQTKREKRRDRLVAATLRGLNTNVVGRDGSPSRPDHPHPNTGGFGETALPGTFEESARFYFNHIPRLTTRPEHIHQLRQTILNLAIRGKLVPQSPEDEPPPKPSGCLPGRESRRSEEEPAESDIGAELGAERERPFAIPATWRWVRVADVAEARLGKMLDKAKNKGTPRPYLRNVSVRWFDFDLSDLHEMNFEDSELEEFSLRAGDVLICEGGEPGRAAVWDERASGIYFQKAIHRIRFVGPVIPIFFVRALRHDAISGRLETYFTGVGIKHLTGKGLARYTFPLPPLSEQRRIMAKVDELMALCDELEAGLVRSDDLCASSLEASLAQVPAS